MANEPEATNNQTDDAGMAVAPRSCTGTIVVDGTDLMWMRDVDYSTSTRPHAAQERVAAAQR